MKKKKSVIVKVNSVQLYAIEVINKPEGTGVYLLKKTEWPNGMETVQELKSSHICSIIKFRQ